MNMTTDITPKAFVFNSPLPCPSRQVKSVKINEKVSLDFTGLVWYTDGSVIGDKAGFGVYDSKPRTRLSCSLASLTTLSRIQL